MIIRIAKQTGQMCSVKINLILAISFLKNIGRSEEEPARFIHSAITAFAGAAAATFF